MRWCWDMAPRVQHRQNNADVEWLRRHGRQTRLNSAIPHAHACAFPRRLRTPLFPRSAARSRRCNLVTRAKAFRRLFAPERCNDVVGSHTVLPCFYALRHRDARTRLPLDGLPLLNASTTVPGRAGAAYNARRAGRILLPAATYFLSRIGNISTTAPLLLTNSLPNRTATLPLTYRTAAGSGETAVPFPRTRRVHTWRSRHGQTTAGTLHARSMLGLISSCVILLVHRGLILIRMRESGRCHRSCAEYGYGYRA